MKRPIRLIALGLMISILAVPGLAQSAGDFNSLKTLVDTEREFSHTSETEGIKAAFLMFMSDGAILFRPDPVNGKEWWQSRPAPTALLKWEPIFADVSAAGDLGYTTGPYKLQPKDGDSNSISHGHYMTIWRRQSDGKWRFVIDFGTSNPPPTNPTLTWTAPRVKAKPAKPVASSDPERLRADLIKLDWQVARTAERDGLGRAFSRFADTNIRLMRKQSFPAVGKPKAVAALAKENVAMTLQPSRADVSASGDLGYTWGSYQSRSSQTSDKPAARGHYVRIWKRSGSGAWRIVLDVANPVEQ